MLLEGLLSILPETYNQADKELIREAYDMAEKAHEGQVRASNEPYFTHCVAVATILAEMGVPPAVVIAGLLHDSVEDTPITIGDVKDKFGNEVANLVDGVTKLTQLPRVSRADQHISEVEKDLDPETDKVAKDRRKNLRDETLRKTFMAMGDDIRVVIIKLADRLHNMRTLNYMPEVKRKRIAQETLDIFAPLANRLGIWQMKWELEDLGFRYTNPEKYKEIADNLAIRRVDREKQIQQIKDAFTTVLSKAGIKAEITGRPKHIYSIYKKMIEKGRPFEMVRDLRAIRLIVPDIPACYAALGVIHTNWRPIPHEFDDYIAAPKDNFYQSLHTAIIYDDGKSVEVQIRTPEMHQSAEYGIAAHWVYKEKGKRNDNYEERINWIRGLMEWRQDVSDASEFVDGMRSDVFGDIVYVFTPRGDIIDLPAGSTPIDFAYTVHTEIGHRCRGAKINGKLVTLDYVLKTGDQVEVLTAKQGGPSRDWLNSSLGMVKSQRARSKIRSWFKQLDREQNLAQGKLILDKELKRLGLQGTSLDDLAGQFNLRTLEELYVAIGCGDLQLGKIINQLSIETKDLDVLEAHPSTDTQKPSNTITVVGLKGILTTIARCCNPLPGDDITGYVTRGRGVTVHRSDCPNVLQLSADERIIKVSWGDAKTTYPVLVEIHAYDRQGLMMDVSNILSNENVNLADVSLKTSHNQAVINLTLDVGDISQLSRVLTRIENLPNVIEAHRLRPG